MVSNADLIWILDRRGKKKRPYRQPPFLRESRPANRPRRLASARPAFLKKRVGAQCRRIVSLRRDHPNDGCELKSAWAARSPAVKDAPPGCSATISIRRHSRRGLMLG
jgi:hypothetical protein